MEGRERLIRPRRIIADLGQIWAVRMNIDARFQEVTENSRIQVYFDEAGKARHIHSVTGVKKLDRLGVLVDRGKRTRVTVIIRK